MRIPRRNDTSNYGQGFFVGANGYTAWYDEETENWVERERLPFSNERLVNADAPGAVLPNGKVLIAAHREIITASFRPPTWVFEYDPWDGPLGKYTQTPLPLFPGPGPLLPQIYGTVNVAAVYTRMLVLPTGQVLFSVDNRKYMYIYTPDGSPDTAWKPTITEPPEYLGGTRYRLRGTGLTGVSEGAHF